MFDGSEDSTMTSITSKQKEGCSGARPREVTLTGAWHKPKSEQDPEGLWDAGWGGLRVASNMERGASELLWRKVQPESGVNSQA